ncbi:MAG: DUF5320 family protein [Patescibacteria group bacterium]
MPNFNGMGPNNQGPMTGRGMGPCGGGYGMGRRGGRGLGRGRCCDYSSAMPYQPTKEEYKKMLQTEIEDLQQELKQLES